MIIGGGVDHCAPSMERGMRRLKANGQKSAFLYDQEDTHLKLVSDRRNCLRFLREELWPSATPTYRRWPMPDQYHCGWCEWRSNPDGVYAILQKMGKLPFFWSRYLEKQNKDPISQKLQILWDGERESYKFDIGFWRRKLIRGSQSGAMAPLYCWCRSPAARGLAWISSSKALSRLLCFPDFGWLSLVLNPDKSWLVYYYPPACAGREDRGAWRRAADSFAPMTVTG